MKIFYAVLGITVSWLQPNALPVQGMVMWPCAFCCASENAHVQARFELDSGSRVEDAASIAE